MEFLASIFGRAKTPQEQLRENKQALNRAMRGLDRERQRAEQMERAVIIDIKKMAKEGQVETVRIMAKEVVRIRQHIKKFLVMRASIQVASLKLQAVQGQDSMAQAMEGASRAMRCMTSQMNLPAMQEIMADFDKQTTIADMKQETLDDVLEDVMEGPEDDEDADTIVNKVLDELGIQMNEKLNQLPNVDNTAGIESEVSNAPPPRALTDADFTEFQARLEKLRTV